MDAEHVQDLIQRGLGRAALAVGEWCDAYRPAGAHRPLDAQHRYLRLQAVFGGVDGNFIRPVGYGQALRVGIFDAAYTRVGDYLVRAKGPRPGTWFIAAQDPLMGVLCVEAVRVVEFSRPASAAAAGVNAYGGVTRASAAPLLTGWPASVLNGTSRGLDRTGLPGDSQPGGWQVLLPAVHGVVLRSGDLMRDDLGRNGVVAEAEVTDLGWRLTVKQATT